MTGTAPNAQRTTNGSKKVFAREATGLTREIGARDALTGNILAMGVAYLFVFAFYSSLLYPGVDLPITVLFTLIPGVVVTLIYYLFTVVMPRTGGDYVWVSRVVHPSIGFLTNFLITFALMSSVAVGPAWAVSYGLSPMFVALGLITSNSALSNIGVSILSPTTSFVITTLLMSVFIVPLFLGTKNVFRVLWGLFAVAALGTVVTVLAFFLTPQSVFAANFNRLSGMNYAQTIASSGLPMGFSLSMTLTGSIFTITNFLGFYTSAYYTGEVKRVQSSQIYAMLGSIAVMAVFGVLVYASAYHAVGSSFLDAISLLSGSGSSSYLLAAPPTLNFLVAFAVPNPWIIILSALALVATGLATATVFSFVCVRNLFAWSFDRLMPTAIAKIDSKRGSPYVAIGIIWILSILFVAVYFYTIFFQFYIYSTLEIFIAFILASIAAILFPYRKKELFSSAPSFVKKKIGSVPWITVLGVLGVALNGYLAYATLQPAVTPPPSGALVRTLAYAVVPVTIIAAFAIYSVAHAYRRRQGFDLGLAYKEIPPE
jgi:APA family basic amino acid/polyamine antiporter